MFEHNWNFAHLPRRRSGTLQSISIVSFFYRSFAGGRRQPIFREQTGLWARGYQFFFELTGRKEFSDDVIAIYIRPIDFLTYFEMESLFVIICIRTYIWISSF